MCIQGDVGTHVLMSLALALLHHFKEENSKSEKVRPS